MSLNILKAAAAAALVSTAAPVALLAQTDPFSDAYVVGAYVSYNQREGYRKYDGVDKYHHVENTNPFIYGLAVGKRFALGSARLRIQAGAEGAWGSVSDGDFYVATNEGDLLSTLYSVYTTGGINADLHLLFPSHARMYFLSVGPIAHLTYFNTSLKTKYDRRDITGLDTWYIAFSPGVSAGVGVEYATGVSRASSFCYNLRFMQSAHYTETGGLFPMGVDYREFFFTHMLTFQVLLPAGGNIFRR